MYHPTLNSALKANSEKLIDLWPIGFNIGYNQLARCVVDGVYISVYRDNHGMYEEAVSYSSSCDDFQRIQDCFLVTVDND